MKKTLLALLSLGLAATPPLMAPLMAEEATAPTPPDQTAPADAPPPAMPSDEREAMEPEVTIIRREDRTVEEYRINGQLYMVKITPSKGYPYYLVDADGDGNLETQRNELDPKILVPSWVILRW
ncbi:MAG TPA: DUF2782 domain-containing protein [Gammaproteobacteria bacterium]|nr:DUF2782 domain-containing protein [Gammaproteobacteria bacterium]